MPQDYPTVFAILALIGLCARGVAVSLRNRRNPAPAIEQLSEGIGWGIALGLAILGVRVLL